MIYFLGEFTLSFNKTGHLVVIEWLHEAKVHLFVLFQQIHHLLNPFADNLYHGFGIIEPGILIEHAHSVAGRKDHFALEGALNAGNNLHQGRLTGAVETYDTDFGTIEEREVDIFENLFMGREYLVDTHHRKDDFFIVGHCSDLREGKEKGEGD